MLDSARLHRLASLLSRVALVIATFAQVPKLLAESQAECESIAVVARDSATAVEHFRAVARYHGLKIQSCSRGLYSPPAYELGLSGRRLSATLLAPMRC